MIGEHWRHLRTGNVYVVVDLIKAREGTTWFDAVLYRRTFSWRHPFAHRPLWCRSREAFNRGFTRAH